MRGLLAILVTVPLFVLAAYGAPVQPRKLFFMHDGILRSDLVCSR